MSGAIAHNFHEGSRSELLARYVFTAFGAATPILREEDWGLDLFCALTETVGKRAWAKECYTVQVKSTQEPWIFESREEVQWLIDHPLPLFLCTIDKGSLLVRIYPLTTRFALRMYPQLPDRFELTLGDSDEVSGTALEQPQVRATGEGDSSILCQKGTLYGPCLKFLVSDLQDDKKRSNFKEIVKSWVQSEENNLRRKRLGMKSYEMCSKYNVNQMPTFNMRSSSQIHDPKFVESLKETLELFGQQCFDADVSGAIKSALLYRHVTKDAIKSDDIPWPGFLSFVYAKLDESFGAKYMGESLDQIASALDSAIAVRLKESDKPHE